jgi:hypothetical protein
LELARQSLNPCAFGRPAQSVAHGDHHGERSHNGGDVQSRDQHAIDRPEHASDQRDRDEDRDDRHSGLRRHLCNEAGRHAADGELRPDGNVDLSSQNDHRHSDGHDQRWRIAYGQIAKVGERIETGRGDRDERQKRDVSNRRRSLARRLAQRFTESFT